MAHFLPEYFPYHLRYESSTLHLGFIPETITNEALEGLCKMQGIVIKLVILQRAFSRQAFCKYKTERMADKALLYFQSLAQCFKWVCNYARTKLYHDYICHRGIRRNNEINNETYFQSIQGKVYFDKFIFHLFPNYSDVLKEENNTVYENVEIFSATLKSLNYAFDKYTPKTTLQVILLGKFKNSLWLSLLIPENFNYLSLKYEQSSVDFEEENDYVFAKDECNILAALMKGKCMCHWFRAIQLPCGDYLFIDIGAVVERCNILKIVKCPKKYVREPVFTCMLELSQNETRFAETLSHKVKIEPKTRKGSVQFIDGSGTRGHLNHWLV